MKFGITITILVLIALGLNIKISNNIKWQREAESEWNRMLDPSYNPRPVDKIIKSCKAINYVLAQEKYYRKQQ